MGRFVQADTVVPEPGNPQALNRYAYALNNPLRYTDPSGYCIPDVNCPGDRYTDEPAIVPPAKETPAEPVLPVEQGPGDPAFYWGLLAERLGPPDIDQLFEPFSSIPDYMSAWPDKERTENDLFWYRHDFLIEVYGGEEGLRRSASKACASQSCNNIVLNNVPDLPSGFRYHLKAVLDVLGTGPQRPQAFFLKEVYASPNRAFNFEPLWMSELMKQYPKKLLVAEGKWVLYAYLPNPEAANAVRLYGGLRIVSPSP